VTLFYPRTPVSLLERAADIVLRCRQLCLRQRGSCDGASQRIQLSLNSFGSAFFSLTPRASDGLLEYGLRVLFGSWDAGRAFSSFTSVPLTTRPFFDVNGSRNGGMLSRRYLQTCM
jgi:hypothetical protein